jgi:hypothetical protein
VDLVLLAALVLGDLVTAGISYISIRSIANSRDRASKEEKFQRQRLHVVRELLQVDLLLGELLLELLELLLLALADRKVLASTLPPLEGVTVPGNRLVIG